jgi:F-type H+-transporting ATPase subunit gamma
MMLSSIAIDKKLKTFYFLEDIVNAMKAYAGVTIRKTEELVLNIRTYEENVLYAFSDLLVYYPEITPEKTEGKRILICFGSSQGLCGSFNDKLADDISGNIANTDRLFVIGRRLKSSLDSRGISSGDYINSVVSVNGIQEALNRTISRIKNIYGREGYYNLNLIFIYVANNEAMTSIERILPPDIRRVRDIKPATVNPLSYIDPEKIFESILEEFLYISLYRGYMESLRSENWYRLRSMENAHEGLKQRIAELDSLKKYIRQEEITEEMLEIQGNKILHME